MRLCHVLLTTLILQLYPTVSKRRMEPITMSPWQLIYYSTEALVCRHIVPTLAVECDATGQAIATRDIQGLRALARRPGSKDLFRWVLCL